VNEIAVDEDSGEGDDARISRELPAQFNFRWASRVGEEVVGEYQLSVIEVDAAAATVPRGGTASWPPGCCSPPHPFLPWMRDADAEQGSARNQSSVSRELPPTGSSVVNSPPCTRTARVSTEIRASGEDAFPWTVTGALTVRGVRAEAPATGHRFHALLLTLDEGEGTFGRLLNEPDLHEQLELTLESLNRIIRDFEGNPGRYLRELTLFRLF